MYGISETDKIFLKTKLENQKKFLDSNFFMINGEYVPYSNFYFSSWHNSNLNLITEWLALMIML